MTAYSLKTFRLFDNNFITLILAFDAKAHTSNSGNALSGANTPATQSDPKVPPKKLKYCIFNLLKKKTALIPGMSIAP